MAVRNASKKIAKPLGALLWGRELVVSAMVILLAVWSAMVAVADPVAAAD